MATKRQQYLLLEEKHCGTEGSMEEPGRIGGCMGPFHFIKKCLVTLLLLCWGNGIFDHFGHYESTRWPLPLPCSRHNEKHEALPNLFLGFCSLAKDTLPKVTNQVPGPKQRCWVSTWLYYNWKVALGISKVLAHVPASVSLVSIGWARMIESEEKLSKLLRNAKK